MTKKVNGNSVSARLAAGLVLGYILVFPLLAVRIPAAPGEAARWLLLLLTAVILAATLAVRFAYGRRLPVGIAGGLVLAFGLTSAAAWMTAIHTPTAWYGGYDRLNGFLSLLAVMALFFSVSQLRWDDAEAKKARDAIVALGLVLGCYALVQYAMFHLTGTTDPEFGDRARASLDNPLTLASYLVAILPVSIVYALEERQLWALLAPAAVASGLGVTFARSGWLGALVAMIVLGMGLAGRKAFDRRRVITLATAILVPILLVGVASLASGRADSNIAGRMRSLTQGGGALTERVEIWRAAGAAIRERPLLGYGTGTFRLVFPRFETSRYAGASGSAWIADDAHNLWLQTALDAGLVGLMLFIATVTAVLVTAVRRLRHRPQLPEGERRLTVALIAGLVGLLVTMSFGVLNLANMSLVWLMLALTAYIGPRDYFSVGGGDRALGVLAGLATALVVAASVLSPVLAYPKYLSTYAAIARGGNDQAMMAMRQAVDTHPYYDDFYWTAGSLWAQRFAATGGRAELAAAISSFKLGIGQNRHLADHYAYLADLYLTAGDKLGNKDYFRMAEDTALRGLRVRPRSGTFYQMLAAAYRGLGRSAKATEAQRKALVLGEPDEWSSHYGETE